MGKMNPLEKCEKCPDFIFEDVQAYIKRLEEQNAELVRKTEQLLRERDAAVADLRFVKDCKVCKYASCLSCDEPCCHCVYQNYWEWRGVPEPPEEE